MSCSCSSAERRFSLPSTSFQLRRAIDRRSSREGGRRTVGSPTPEIEGIRGLRKRRGLHPCLVLVQLRSGRHGRDPGRENSLRPLLPPCLDPCDSLSSIVSRIGSCGADPPQRRTLAPSWVLVRADVRGVGAPMRAGACKARTSARTNESIENAAYPKRRRLISATRPSRTPSQAVTRAGNARHSVTTPVTTI